MKQVFYNLLSNAVKFTDSKKAIGIEASYEEENVIVEIWDQGIGISEDDLERVFNPFEQAVQSANKPVQGTGLGLSITKRLVELHNGTLTATSEIGKGSRFKVILPGRIPDDEERSPDNTTRDFVQKQGETVSPASILVTEDNPANTELIKAVLEKYELDFAQNGEEAVKKASEKLYDLILMDIPITRSGRPGGNEADKRRQKPEYPNHRRDILRYEGG